jgi:uncharacterized protein (DUF58 family)
MRDPVEQHTRGGGRRFGRWLLALPARIRRWLRPPRVLRPTRAGWLFLGIILGVGFAALNTGNNLLYLVLSLLLAFLVLSGVLSESALRGVRVRRRVPRELFARQQNAILLEVSNSQRRVASYAVVVEDRLRPAPNGAPQTLYRSGSEEAEPGPMVGFRKKRRSRRSDGEAAGRSFFLRIGPGELETRRYTLSPSRRGELAFAGFRVYTRFPFGLFLKYRDFDADEQVLVFPTLLSTPVQRRVQENPVSGDVSVTRVGQGGAVGGLREFRDGDSVRRVHWRTSLRRGSLLVSETEDERAAQIEVRLHARAAPNAPASDRFERAVSRAASEVVAHLRDGLAVALRTDSAYLPADVGPRQRTRLLGFLAQVAPDGGISREIQS